MADPDILTGCKAWASQRRKRPCPHTADERAEISLWMPLVTVDSWLEFLDQPIVRCVVRARGNTTARLAAAALAAQQSREVLIVPREECWQCLKLDFHPAATPTQSSNDLDEGDGSENSSDVGLESYGDEDLEGTLGFDFDLNPLSDLNSLSEAVAAKAVITFVY